MILLNCCLRNDHLDRWQADRLLKDLDSEAMLLLDEFSIEEISPKRFQLKIKGVYQLEVIKEYLKYSGLTIKEDNGFLLIY